MVEQRDPRDDLGRDEPARQSRPQFHDPEPTGWKTYVFGGVAAILIILAAAWTTSTGTPNQQSAQNQPRVEGPADRSPSPPETPAPSPPSP
jgi:hypothetical protein